MKSRKQQKGFTLVELAIVLVIIGLIIGGVLVGQDLIKAAEIRTVVTDFEKFNAGATAFRTKYNGYPGDLLNTRASQFGLTASATNGTDGLADGDGILENGAAAARKSDLGGENSLFWLHLSEAQLIPFGFEPVAGVNDGTADATVATNADMTAIIPTTRLRDSADFHAYGWAGRNYFYVGGITAATAGPMTTEDGLSPLEAENVDSKMDDGVPTTGILRARLDVDDANVLTEAQADPGVGSPVAGDCVNQGAGAAIVGDEFYNLAEQFQNDIACQIRLRASF